MEVLRHGNTYKEIECNECGALLSYCDRDIKKAHISEYHFDTWHDVYTKYVVCPECDAMIKLERLVDGEDL